MRKGGAPEVVPHILFLKIIRLVKLFAPFFFFFRFLSRPSSALISWSSTQVLVDHWGTFCAGGYPNVHFSFFLPGGCGGV